MPPPLETNSGGLAKDMTLRDWFAGQALPAIIEVVSSGNHTPKAIAEWKPELGHKPSIEQAMAADAYALADALLIERERGE